MNTSSSISRQWSFFLLTSALLSISLSLYMYFTENEYKVISIINITLFMSSIIYQLYCFKKRISYKNILDYRIYTDNAAFFISTIFMYKYNSFVFLYIITTWFHILAIFINDLKKDALNFIQACLVLMIPLFIITRNNDINIQDIVFISFILITFFSIIFANKRIQQIKKIQENEKEMKKIEKTLLKHNFGNMASIITAFSDCELVNVDENFSKSVNRALDTIGNIIDTICSEESNMNIKLHSITDRVISGAIVKYGCIITKNIDSNLIINTNLCSFLNSISTFIMNACEANSTLIKIYIKDGRYLHIEDNGVGFDIKNIKSGYTTKSNGHGIGLINAINILRFLDITVLIKSEIGVGTDICVDLKNVLFNN